MVHPMLKYNLLHFEGAGILSCRELEICSKCSEYQNVFKFDNKNI